MPQQNTSLKDMPFELRLLDPPYAHEEAISPAGLSNSVLQPGAVLIIEIVCRENLRSLLRQWIPVVRRQCVAAPVVLRFRGPAQTDDVHLARFAGALRVRAVLVHGEAVVPALRELLTQPANLADDFAEWLSLVRPRADARVLRVVRELLRVAPDAPSLADALARVGEHEHTVRDWLHAAQLPSAGNFIRVGRTLPMLLEIQRFPKASIQTVIRGYGPIDLSSFSHQVQRLFGVRPGFIRSRLGWQWLALRFIQRRA